jgi:acyl-CoA thioester hydrolase
MLDNFNMGGESAKKDKKTTFVAEMHTIYNQEVKLGEEVETHVTYIEHDKKRIHYRLSMFHKEKKYLAATNEVLSLYVDLSQRKVVEFDLDRIKIMDNFVKNNSSKFNTDKLVFSGKLKK